jgi:hypothetical protein
VNIKFYILREGLWSIKLLSSRSIPNRMEDDVAGGYRYDLNALHGRSDVRMRRALQLNGNPVNGIERVL